jgi:hypothetical protein
MPLASECGGQQPSVQRIVIDDEDVPCSTLHPFLLAAPLTREARSPHGAAKECSTPLEAPATVWSEGRRAGVRKGCDVRPSASGATFDP